MPKQTIPQLMEKSGDERPAPPQLMHDGWIPYRRSFHAWQRRLFADCVLIVGFSLIFALLVFAGRPLKAALPEAQYILPMIWTIGCGALVKAQFDNFATFAKLRGEIAMTLVALESGYERVDGLDIASKLAELQLRMEAGIEASELVFAFSRGFGGRNFVESAFFLREMTKAFEIEDECVRKRSLNRCAVNIRNCLDIEAAKVPAAVVAYQAELVARAAVAEKMRG